MGSLPPVSAKFVGDVEHLLAQLKRADSATKSSTASMDREVDKFTKNIKRKFSIGDVGKDMLRGFGIGSGFALAEKGAEMLVSHFERMAEMAKLVEDRTAHQLETTKQIIALHQTDAQQLATAEKDAATAYKKLQEALSQKYETRPTFDDTGAGQSFVTIPVSRTKEEEEAVNALSKAYDNLRLKVEQMRKRASDSEKSNEESEAIKVHAARIAFYNDQIRKQEAAFDDLISAKKRDMDENDRLTKQTEELANKYRELADPTLKFTKQIEEANKLAAAGKITYKEAARAVAELRAEMEEDKNRRVDIALDRFFGDTDKWEKAKGTASKYSQEIERIVGRAADGMADAFVDALSGVEDAWANLGKMIAQEIARVIIQITVVKPLINGLGSMFSSIGSSLLSSIGSSVGFSAIGAAMGSYGTTGKASGGSVDAGYTYRVNENGEEFFRPDVGGTIIPVGASGGMRNGRGGNTYVIDARGTDESVIQRLEQALIALAGPGVVERRALSAVMSKKNRGGVGGTALA